MPKEIKESIRFNIPSTKKLKFWLITKKNNSNMTDELNRLIDFYIESKGELCSTEQNDN